MPRAMTGTLNAQTGRGESGSDLETLWDTGMGLVFAREGARDFIRETPIFARFPA